MRDYSVESVQLTNLATLCNDKYSRLVQVKQNIPVMVLEKIRNKIIDNKLSFLDNHTNAGKLIKIFLKFCKKKLE